MPKLEITEGQQPSWWYRRLFEILGELASEREQTRLWLSTGENGTDIGSFTEAICHLFDDLGVSDLQKEELEASTSKAFLEALEILERNQESVNEYQPPLTLIRSPEMSKVRIAAADAMAALLFSFE